MRRIFGYSWLASTLAFASVAQAADMQAPDDLVRNTAQEVLTVVKQDKSMRSGNQQKLLDLVEAKVLPHFDFVRMTRLTAARNWRVATPERLRSCPCACSRETTK